MFLKVICKWLKMRFLMLVLAVLMTMKIAVGRCWQVLGEGQFMPNYHAKPFIGHVNKLTIINEYRVEMVCAANYIEATAAALKLAHPYEQPAFDIVKVEQF